MSNRGKYLLIASMDVDAAKEALFHEVYDQEHVPNLSKVPGVLSVSRYEVRELTLRIGGEEKVVRFENEPKHHTFYEIDSPDVLVSDEWAEATELGRWPEQVRPYTRNRRHILAGIKGES